MSVEPIDQNADRYNPQAIEPKWAKYWSDHRLFEVINQITEGRPKFYVLDMFPYPSGVGLHVGHPRGYVASDVIARWKRMQGFDVLHPMGWDSFGLPTERQADKEHVHPTEITARNIALFRHQLKLLGLSYDWSREFATSDPAYYKWTQWIFLKLYERDLAYLAEVPVNWCPALSTVLANEEVKDGVYIETGDPVERRLMGQWMLRITAYAERLLDDLSILDWPESLKEMQRNWIGRSEGAIITFFVSGQEVQFDVFSTRPETLFGCTFCVLAPENPLVQKITADSQVAEVSAYSSYATHRSERERIAAIGTKTGVFTGAYAINPVNGAIIPVWISDYVLGGYGTGAVFGCPAHDDRDYEFAKTFGLPIVPVIFSENMDSDTSAYSGDGRLINSEFLNGMTISMARSEIILFLEQSGKGNRQVKYALRDWLFSRQRYWGEPIPMMTVEGGGSKPVSEDELPVLLPLSLPEKSPTDTSPAPLARAKEWVRITDPITGLPALRETNTMPQWAGSSWYFLRFVDPHNTEEAWASTAEKRWMPVDLYVGGAEHATLHLLYARFWHKVLFDLGHVSTPEPFQRLFNQGMVHSRSFRDDRGRYYYVAEVEERDGEWFTRRDGTRLNTQIEKMSKSRSNGIAPEEVIAEFGADSLRIYEVFMGPMEESVLWQTDGIIGVRRFLDRAWRLVVREIGKGVTLEHGAHPQMERLLHRTISKVTADLEKMSLNTAVSQLMIFVNDATKCSDVPTFIIESFVCLLSPFAPHLAEELWQLLGHSESIAFEPWPTFDPKKCVEDFVDLVVQVNSKVRAKVRVLQGTTQDGALDEAGRDPLVAKYLANTLIDKVFFVPDRLLNIVTT